jgi:hypothetical protein
MSASVSIGIWDETFIAGEDLRLSQFCAVKLDSTERQVVLCDAGTDVPIGVLQNKPNEGEAATVRLLGSTVIKANGPFALHDTLAVAAATGKVDTLAAQTYVLGIAMTAATAQNDLIEMILNIRPALEYDTLTTLAVEDDGTSGADQVHITPITELGAADTVQEGLEELVSGGILPAKLAATAIYKQSIHIAIAGDIAASVAATLADIAHGAGVITRAGLRLGNTGTDGTDDLIAELDVLIGGVSIFTTTPKLAKTAADGAHTFTAGAGVTVGVVNAAANIIADKSLITYSLTLTRTTPEDEIADALIVIDVAYKVGV